MSATGAWQPIGLLPAGRRVIVHRCADPQTACTQVYAIVSPDGTTLLGHDGEPPHSATVCHCPFGHDGKWMLNRLEHGDRVRIAGTHLTGTVCGNAWGTDDLDTVQVRLDGRTRNSLVWRYDAELERLP